MGQQELKAALIRDGEARARAFWEAAEREVADRRKEVECTRQEAETAVRQRLERAGQELAAEYRGEAERQCRSRRIAAEQALAERLRTLAVALLPDLLPADRSGLLERLAAELPPDGWTAVQVGPQDLELARRLYPELEVNADEQICGGLAVLASDGRIRLDNSLTVRLDRAWPELTRSLLPLLRSKVTDAATSAEKP